MITKMLMPAYAKKLWKSINDNFVRQYTVMLVRITNDYKTATINDLLTKAKKEQFFIKDIFAGNLNKKDSEESGEFLNLYTNILTEPPTEMVGDIVKLSIRLKEDYTDNTLVKEDYKKTIMKIRSDFGDKEKKKLLDELKAHNALALKGKRDLALEFYKACMKELHVNTFIKNIKKNYQDKKKLKMKVINNQEKSKYLSISTNERKVVFSHQDNGRSGKGNQRLPHDEQKTLHSPRIRSRNSRSSI